MPNPYAFARKLTIYVRGETEEARDEALAEAIRSIEEGNTSGSDRNDNAGFYFDSTDNVPNGELPA